jgi:hypothetical protein
VRRAARLLALLGAVGLGFLLFRPSARDVVLVYDLAGAPGARALEVVILRDGRVQRRARFEAPGPQVRHAVKLGDGSYRLDFRLEAPGGPLQGQRTFTVAEGGSIVLALGR